MPASSWLYTLPAVLFVLRLLKAKAPPSRELLLPPAQERVLLLGASSGVGKDLAVAYAKRGAKVCIFARRADSLKAVRDECIGIYGKFAAGSIASKDLEARILVHAGDITNEKDLLAVRDLIMKEWGGLDTLHILAGVPSTSTLLELAGVGLAKLPSSTVNRVPNQRFDLVPLHGTAVAGDARWPDEAGLTRLAREARACSEVNYVGTVLALGCFIPLLASTSPSPALHHLSSVAATIPAPCRALYSATKAAALMAVESCRVECEGSGVRFFSLLPGTIANDFRTKTTTSNTGGRDETRLDIPEGKKLLLAPETVVETILHHLALAPAHAPLIPYPPFSWFSSLNQPPKATHYLPLLYRIARWAGDTPLGWGYVEPGARRKYGLVNQ